MDWSIVIICVEIFFCRILDVSIGTVRAVLTVKDKPKTAAMMGFVEAFLWFVVVRQAMNLATGGVWVALAYAAGFATGTYVGGVLAAHLIRTNHTVQIVTTGRDDELVAAVRAAGFGAAVLDVKGSDFGGERYMLFCEIPSNRLRELKNIVHSRDKTAFIMVQETKYVYNGFMKK